MSDRQPDFGINLYGHVTGNFGLAVAARNTLRALRVNDVDTCIIDIDAGTGRSGHDNTYSSLACPSLSGTYQTSLFHTNPTDVYSFAIETPAGTWAPDRLRVLVPFWELPIIPEGLWTDFVSAMDLVLAPTQFIAESIRVRCPETKIVHYPQAVFLPDGVAPDRKRFGLSATAFTCLTVMDASSGFERKNPFASVAAFRSAFADLGPEDARLVVKMTDRRGAKLFSAQLEEFRAQAESDPRIQVIEESMSYVDVLSLNASADVLLSLHRAEGLGLNLMEAMSLGTVVLGTGWSGNMDFMTSQNSVIVGCSETPVCSAHPSYAPEVVGEDQYWMEPNAEEAAVELRRLYEDRALLGRLATRARDDMESARISYLRGEWIASVQALLEDGTLDSAEHQARSTAFREVMRVGVGRRMKRAFGNGLRRVGLL